MIGSADIPDTVSISDSGADSPSDIERTLVNPASSDSPEIVDPSRPNEGHNDSPGRKRKRASLDEPEPEPDYGRVLERSNKAMESLATSFSVFMEKQGDDPDLRKYVDDRLSDMKNELIGARIDMKNELIGVRSDLKNELIRVRIDMDNELIGVMTNMKHELIGVRRDIAKMKNDIITTIATMLRERS